MDTTKQAKIPIVVFSKLEDLKPGTSSWLSARKQVCDALEEHSYFVARLSEEVCLELHNRIFSALDDLFDFPKESREKNMSEKPFRGHYSDNVAIDSVGIDDATSLEEALNFAKIFWPNGNDRFSEIVNSYGKFMTGLDQTVTRMIFDYYGVEKYKCDSHIKSMEYVLKFTRYKLESDHHHLQKKEQPYVAIGEHEDLSFTTIIHDNDVNGLEIKTKDGKWIVFDGSPSSFLVMASDALQLWSNDRIKPCTHRVVLRENKVRYSLLLLTYNKGIICVPEELIDEEHSLRYKPLNHPEYVALQYRDTKTRLCLKSFCGV
ncbi:2-oxoglutarate-dependent dioxygenase AOP3 isoform X1 [Morus notabilis]|uniref:2-oxoglutarate-dependent dioxygenase AOP3 isoform X1 n=1 Tax=Morus notabilis TaxID=981085 RepID=UPI000CED49A7|nr:2-oxoglutarate-dependent dioxygenase AOP3 isoform X1 [Morus notabilis]